MDGQKKAPVLFEANPDIFFDDQKVHLKPVAGYYYLRQGLL